VEERGEKKTISSSIFGEAHYDKTSSSTDRAPYLGGEAVANM
jgi:hypothetical protein